MKIIFPINNYSHTYNILSELFEVDLDTRDDNFSFQWNDNRITCSRNNGDLSLQSQGLSIELFHWQHSCFELEKRLEFFCYKNQMTLEKIGIKVDRLKQSILWNISPIVTLEIYFSPTNDLTLS